jgi:nucleotide-binding universal stress UspA family protein
MSAESAKLKERSSNEGTTMLNHILVPLDSSTISEQALRYVPELLAPNGKLALLSIIEQPLDYWYSPMDAGLPVAPVNPYSETQYRSAYSILKEYLNSKANNLREKTYEVECLIETGDPATLILEVAKSHKVDAIVMTSHGRTGLSRWIFGSVTQKVISRMGCPVLIVPARKADQADSIEIEKQNLPSKT